jgi:hypothetical protein
VLLGSGVADKHIAKQSNEDFFSLEKIKMTMQRKLCYIHVVNAGIAMQRM